MFLKILPLLIAGTITDCASSSGGSLGVQPGFQSYVPAKIAILPCREWPNQTKLAGTPPTIEEGPVALCKLMDSFILSGFGDQPYMKGYSPKAVLSLLKKSGSPSAFLDSLFSWKRPDEPCKTCQKPQDYYSTHIQSQEKWLTDLKNFSDQTRSSDAVLIPLINFAAQKQYSDRGLHFAERSSEVSLMLIDSLTGKLIWMRTRKTTTANHNINKDALHYNEWKQLAENLFSEQLWQDFPGRLTP